MKKTTIIGLTALLAVSILTVTAARVWDSSQPTFSPAQAAEPADNSQKFKLKCDGVEIEIEDDEPDGEWDANDVQTMINSLASNCTTVTELEIESSGEKYITIGNNTGWESDVKSEVCSSEGKEYDDKTDDCITPQDISS